MIYICAMLNKSLSCSIVFVCLSTHSLTYSLTELIHFPQQVKDFTFKTVYKDHIISAVHMVFGVDLKRVSEIVGCELTHFFCFT